jgi:alpha-tubulin suppressor-like RCC1 family protein
MSIMSRRQAVAILAAIPFAARVNAQTAPGPKHRVILGPTHGFLLEPGGKLEAWVRREAYDGIAPDWLGLGHNNPLPAFTLAAVPRLTNVVAAAAGSACSFAVLGDGRLLAWGDNSGSGLLGTTARSVVETTASWGPSSSAPLPVAAQFDAIDVSSQDTHVLALSRDGRVHAWGKGDKGQLGVGALPVINFKTHTPAAMTYVPYPVRVPNLTDVTAISAGRRHSLALLGDGTVRAWGENDMGQVGDGTTIDRDAPVSVRGVRNAVAISAGARFSAALLADGTVMMWGAFGGWAFANRGGRPPVPTPGLVPGARHVRAIATGVSHVVALTDTGGLMTWGDNTFCDLGRGTRATSAPALVTGVAGVQSIAVSDATSVAVLETGRILTWGHVRQWTRPEPGYATLSSRPILLWLDGLNQPG